MSEAKRMSEKSIQTLDSKAVEGADDMTAARQLANLSNELWREAEDELAQAHGYAHRLLIALMEKHYHDRSPDWQPLPDLMGVLTQIDNLSTGLVRNKALELSS